MVADLQEYDVNLKPETGTAPAKLRAPGPIRYEQFLEAVNNTAVHYQPIINIRTNTSIGAEALVRPQTISEGMGLQEFIGYAQQHDFVPRITEVVLKDVLRRAKSSVSAFAAKAFSYGGKDIPATFTYTVNVSPACLMDQACIDLANQFLHLTSPRFRLILEMSEASSFPSDLLAEFHEKTGKDDRLGFALDDFGVGQSRFENLNSPLVKWAKIDKSFLTFKQDQDIFRTLTAIVEFAQFFDCDIIIEGIETQGQLDLVSKLENVNLAQGYLLARPAPWQ